MLVDAADQRAQPLEHRRHRPGQPVAAVPVQECRGDRQLALGNPPSEPVGPRGRVEHAAPEQRDGEQLRRSRGYEERTGSLKRRRGAAGRAPEEAGDDRAQPEGDADAGQVEF